jgi:hypothetical protein
MGDLMFIADMVADETWKSNPRTGQNECRRSSDRDSGFVICDLELGAFRSFRTLGFRVCSMLEVPLPLLVGGTSLSRFGTAIGVWKPLLRNLTTPNPKSNGLLLAALCLVFVLNLGV